MKIVRHNVGDKVIALNSSTGQNGQHRVKGKVYTVNAIRYCENDGHQCINLGETYSGSGILNCACGSDHSPNGMYWTRSELFAQPQQMKEMLEEAVEEENYELAQLLHDAI